MNRDQLIEQIRQKKSYLCVGLDTDVNKLPAAVKGDVLAFNRAIIEATAPYCVSYKLNTAFYESQGARGWELMAATRELIPETHFAIADAKRGDIGNTTDMYARAFFDKASSGMSFDAITAAPYMGRDSLEPFFKYKDKWTIVLGLTSNAGSADFEQLPVGKNEMLYERVLDTFTTLGNTGNLMFVIGATKGELFAHIRKRVPDHFLLVPGVGAQGGDLQAVARYGLNKDCGLLVNASRSILYAGSGSDFAALAAAEAQKIQHEMQQTLQQIGW